MLLKLDSKRRLTIPAKLAPASPGDYFEALYDEDEDKIVFRRVIKRKLNWLEVLKQCPVSMDDIPPRSRELPKKIKL
jgi:bifunctional DNA-binding transcriptional regulator/antitoxin component of YhaV-PrlF toxin-antitoxin module